MPDSAPLPLILAGPILRRMQPDRLTLWIAVSGHTPLQLSLNGTGVDKDFDLDIRNPDIHFVPIGQSLFLWLVDLKLDEPLPFDQFIAYDLTWVDFDTGEPRSFAAMTPEICYPGQTRPGFVLTSRVKSLIHGSCRKPHHPGFDGLTAGDDQLRHLCAADSSVTLNPEDGDERAAWPSFLMMSGDQIYADDVAGPMLYAIHQVIEHLGITTESLEGLGLTGLQNTHDLLAHPDCYYGRMALLPQDKVHQTMLETMFGGVQKPVFTTDTAQNHLITLAEHLVMYLMVWSPVLWRYVDLDPPAGVTKDERPIYDKERPIIEEFVKGLPAARRLMAHLPTAMVFDDHDITDDWNLNRHWEEAVYDHPLSRRMVGNGLTAYFLAQGWGNDPDQFSIETLEGAMTSLENPGLLDHDAFIDDLLGFEGWDFEWDTKPALIVLDTRTRRWRSESSGVKPSGLLDWEALTDLQTRLRGKNEVLLVSAAPILGVKLIETIQRFFTMIGKPLLVDAENWMAHPGTANAILNIFMHRKTPQHFVILSGDVHYSFVYDVALRRMKHGPDIWQICSSGLRNEFPKKLLNALDVANRWLYAPQSPLNWFTSRRRMRITPRRPDGMADGRRVFNGSGIGLVELDEQGRPWRIRQLLKDRKIGFSRMDHHSRWG